MMPEPGIKIEMTKGYRGVKGEIIAATGSEYELYVVRLENSVHLVAGTSAFVEIEDNSF